MLTAACSFFMTWVLNFEALDLRIRAMFRISVINHGGLYVLVQLFHPTNDRLADDADKSSGCHGKCCQKDEPWRNRDYIKSGVT